MKRLLALKFSLGIWRGAVREIHKQDTQARCSNVLGKHCLGKFCLGKVLKVSWVDGGALRSR